MKETGERDAGGRGKIASRPTTQLADLGITRDQSSKWQKLADIPKEDFEAALRGPDKPTITGLIAPPVKQTDPNATWVWGRLQDFERDGILNLVPSDVFSLMPPLWIEYGSSQSRRPL
jgi:hypothetical protein